METSQELESWELIKALFVSHGMIIWKNSWLDCYQNLYRLYHLD